MLRKYSKYYTRISSQIQAMVNVKIDFFYKKVKDLYNRSRFRVFEGIF